MNLKVANLVAVQFGVFIGIMGWLAFSHFPFARQETAGKTRAATAKFAANVPPASKPGDQLSQTVDYPADDEEAQPMAELPVPAPHEYSLAAVQQYSALAAKQYYEQIAPRRYASAALEKRSIATAEAPAYAVVAQEPAVAPVEYVAEPETVAYVEPAPFIAYPATPYVVFSNRHRFANRCRPAADPRGARPAFAHHRRDRGRAHPLGGGTVFVSPAPPSATLPGPAKIFGVVHRQNDSASSCRPTQGFRPHGRR